uniref:Uncharacterized protein n=1 Tax=viral metagenome TaxID=1070528 RepID=A0A6H2A5Q6_9ZZZZ
MGVHLYTYVGAYIEIKTDPKPEEVVTVKCKQHPDLKYKEDNKFCSLCGAELEKISTKEEGELSYYDLFENEEEEEKYEDVLQWVFDDSKDAIFLIGNEYKNPPDCIDKDYGDMEITQKMIYKYQENFKQNYGEIIEFLRTKVNLLDIKFGVIMYYN